MSDLVREVGVSKSAAYKHVRTLSDLGYLVREGDEYHPSFRFLSFVGQTRGRLPFARAAAAVRGLAETTGQPTDLPVRENDAVVYASRVVPGDRRPTHAEGDAAPLHATAVGKAALAYLDDDGRAAAVERAGLRRYTDNTVTDPARLDDERRSVRDRRVAFGREEFGIGTHSVASPALNTRGRPVGAVSVTGTRGRCRASASRRTSSA